MNMRFRPSFVQCLAARLVKLGERGIRVLCGAGINREDEGLERRGLKALRLRSHFRVARTALSGARDGWPPRARRHAQALLPPPSAAAMRPPRHGRGAGLALPRADISPSVSLA